MQSHPYSIHNFECPGITPTINSCVHTLASIGCVCCLVLILMWPVQLFLSIKQWTGGLTWCPSAQIPVLFFRLVLDSVLPQLLRISAITALMQHLTRPQNYLQSEVSVVTAACVWHRSMKRLGGHYMSSLLSCEPHSPSGHTKTVSTPDGTPLKTTAGLEIQVRSTLPVG